MLFLTYIIIYLVFCMFVLCLYTFRDTRLVTCGPLGWITGLCQHIYSCLATNLKLPDFVRASLNYCVYTRNYLFVCLYAVLVCLSYAELYFHTISLIFIEKWDSGTGLHVTYWQPGIAVCLNAVCCWLTSVSDPGFIGRSDLELDVYPYDGVLYKRNQKCGTCRQLKPARSKHCERLGRCVARYDHYCVWTASAIGRGNHKVYLCFLATLVASAWSVCLVCSQVLSALVEEWQLAQNMYIESRGMSIPSDLFSTTQVLFVMYPRPVFLAFWSGLIGAAVLCFLLYHVTLVLTNQTMSERNMASGFFPADKYVNVYNKGVLGNLEEYFGIKSATASKHDKKQR